MQHARPSQSWRVPACFAAVLVGVAVLSAQGERPRKPPSFHWCVTGALASRIDLSATPIRNDAVIFYEQDIGLLPRFWKGHPERGGVPQNADFDAHLTKLRLDVQKAIPDPDWAGFGIIDLESWGPVWEHSQPEQREMSIELARKDHPTRPRNELERIARVNYERSARLLLEGMLRECRTLRPRGKWGYYGYPYRVYEPHAEKLRWLWEGSTAFFPECYTVYKYKDGGRHNEGYAPVSEYIEDTKGKIALARRIGGPNKPVMTLVWMRYHEINQVFGGQFLDRQELEVMLHTPLEAGADGLIFWDAIASEDVARRYPAYLRNEAVPLLNRLSHRSKGTD